MEEKQSIKTCEKCGVVGIPSAQFWLALVLALLGAFTAYLRLQFEVEQLKAWQARKEADAFMASDYAKERVLIEKASLAERVYAEELCRNLKRLESDLDRSPTNDCRRSWEGL